MGFCVSYLSFKYTKTYELYRTFPFWEMFPKGSHTHCTALVSSTTVSVTFNLKSKSVYKNRGIWHMLAYLS